jgi:hypothetical protein
MITVEEAVNNALLHVNRFPNVLPTGNVRLEEFEFNERANHWEITLSFVESPVAGTRSYKTRMRHKPREGLRSYRDHHDRMKHTRITRPQPPRRTGPLSDFDFQKR